MTTWHIVAHRSGKAYVRQSVPQGTISVITGRKTELVELLSVHARHGFDGETFLVPGVPEAENERAALQALRKWQDRLGRSLRGRRMRPTRQRARRRSVEHEARP